MTEFTPVAGRECGDCSACCDLPSIDALQKPPRILCTHRLHDGCRIYGERPAPCRDFFCGWRLLPQLDEAWRPDRCQILLELRPDCVPETYADLDYAFRFTFFGTTERIYWEPFVKLVGGLVHQEFPVYLAVAGKPGFAGTQYFLTDLLKPAVAARDFSRITAALAQAAKICIDAPQTKITYD